MDRNCGTPPGMTDDVCFVCSHFDEFTCDPNYCSKITGNFQSKIIFLNDERIFPHLIFGNVIVVAYSMHLGVGGIFWYKICACGPSYHMSRIKLFVKGTFCGFHSILNHFRPFCK